MQIEVVANPVSTVPTAKGSYQVIDLAYKNKSFQDKLEGKKVMSFTNKDVFAALQKASFGDIFEISRVKNDKGFWDWTAANSGGDVPVQSSGGASPMASNNNATSVKTGNVTPKSNYETAEERAARQVLIVRQSSISSAVEFAVANKIKDEEEVLRLATRFVDYVFGKDNPNKESVPVGIDEPPKNFFEDMDDDLPY